MHFLQDTYIQLRISYIKKKIDNKFSIFVLKYIVHCI